MSEVHLILRQRDIEHIDQLDVYQANGGFEGLRKALSMQPGDVINMVKDAALRGRGGAGFPAGVKWSFLPNNLWPHYVVANGDESEPGTFKDRTILEGNPYQFLEGLMIASYAVQSHLSYVYLRGEFSYLAQKLDACIAELEKAGLLGENILGSGYTLKLFTHLGAGAYVCGEESALLESLNGKIGQPRLRPPFPATAGLYNRPTVINNIETLSNVPVILREGVDFYKQYGTEKSPGTKIFSLSGNVNKPGVYELPLGTTFRELIYDYGGGIRDGHTIKAIMTAGASSSVLVATEEALDTPMDFDSVPQKLGAPLGSASIIILDDTVNLAWVVNKTVSFFRDESCGKCTPCRAALPHCPYSRT